MLSAPQQRNSVPAVVSGPQGQELRLFGQRVVQAERFLADKQDQVEHVQTKIQERTLESANRAAHGRGAYPDVSTYRREELSRLQAQRDTAAQAVRNLQNQYGL